MAYTSSSAGSLSENHLRHPLALQAPLHAGLIVAQGIDVWQFFAELWHRLHCALARRADVRDPSTPITLGVFGLIDVVMIANLPIRVIIGGYETFVSRFDLDTHEDPPEWLDHVNAGVLKVRWRQR